MCWEINAPACPHALSAGPGTLTLVFPEMFGTRVPNTRKRRPDGALSKESLETRQFSRTFLCEDPEGTLCPGRCQPVRGHLLR